MIDNIIPYLAVLAGIATVTAQCFELRRALKKKRENEANINVPSNG